MTWYDSTVVLCGIGNIVIIGDVMTTMVVTTIDVTQCVVICVMLVLIGIV